MAIQTELARWIIVIMGLAENSVMDLRRKEISLMVTAACGVSGGILRMVEGLAWKDFFLALVPGVICLMLVFATKEQVGFGDAWVLLATGCCVNASDLFTAMWLSMTGLSLVALFLYVVLQKNGRFEIPFVPFILAGILCTRSIGV